MTKEEQLAITYANVGDRRQIDGRPNTGSRCARNGSKNLGSSNSSSTAASLPGTPQRPPSEGPS